MKKLLIFGLIFCLLFSSFVLAAESSGTQTVPTTPTASQALDASKQAISNINADQVEVPENIASLARLIFAIPVSEVITLPYLVVLVAFVIFLILIISSIMEFFPLFEGWKAWVGSFVVVALIAISGGIRDSAKIFLAFQINLGSFASLSFLILAAVLLIVGWAITRFLKLIRDKAGIETAKQAGENISLKPLKKKLKDEGLNN